MRHLDKSSVLCHDTLLAQPRHPDPQPMQEEYGTVIELSVHPIDTGSRSASGLTRSQSESGDRNMSAGGYPLYWPDICSYPLEDRVLDAPT